MEFSIVINFLKSLLYHFPFGHDRDIQFTILHHIVIIKPEPFSSECKTHSFISSYQVSPSLKLDKHVGAHKFPKCATTLWAIRTYILNLFGFLKNKISNAWDILLTNWEYRLLSLNLCSNTVMMWLNDVRTHYADFASFGSQSPNLYTNHPYYFPTNYLV